MASIVVIDLTSSIYNKVKEIITWSKNAYSVIIDNNEKSKIPLSRAKYNEIQERLITL